MSADVIEAACLVIDAYRRVAEVARELGVHENLLHAWVRDEQRRMAAAEGAAGRRPDGRIPVVESHFRNSSLAVRGFYCVCVRVRS
jgi:transposase-like protein